MRTVLGLLLGCAVVAGCSSSGSAPGPESTPHDAAGPGVCGLLTSAELKAAVGAAFKAGVAKPEQDSPYGSYSSCLIQEDAHPLNAVTVSTWSKASAYDNVRSGRTPVSGLGDKAVAGSFGAVYVVAKGKTLFVQFYAGYDSIPDAKALAISKKLAAEAITRL